MEKEDVRRTLYELDCARRSLLQPYFVGIGLTIGQGQPRILMCLLQREPMTQRELADACHLDAATMSRTLDRLQEAGLLQRTPKPGSRRSYHVVLTEEGRRKAALVQKGFAHVDEVLWRGISEREMAPALDTLRRMLENFRGAQGETLSP